MAKERGDEREVALGLGGELLDDGRRPHDECDHRRDGETAPIRAREQWRGRGAAASASVDEERCDGGEGGLGIGAPSLTDAAIIYGQDAETVFQTITQGRIGVMPAWAGRLSQAEVNLLTIYVALLATAGGRGVE